MTKRAKNKADSDVDVMEEARRRSAEVQCKICGVWEHPDNIIHSTQWCLMGFYDSRQCFCNQPIPGFKPKIGGQTEVEELLGNPDGIQAIQTLIDEDEAINHPDFRKIRLLAQELIRRGVCKARS